MYFCIRDSILFVLWFAKSFAGERRNWNPVRSYTNARVLIIKCNGLNTLDVWTAWLHSSRGNTFRHTEPTSNPTSTVARGCERKLSTLKGRSRLCTTRKGYFDRDGKSGTKTSESDGAWHQNLGTVPCKARPGGLLDLCSTEPVL
jgi:hypothetical protein